MQTSRQTHATFARAVLVAAAIMILQVPNRAEGSTPDLMVQVAQAQVGQAQVAQAQGAQADDTPQRELQPRYEPVPPQPKSSYNNAYIFAATRGVADSPMMPAAKAPLFLLTVPLDLVLLPFTVIGGFFG